MRFKPKASSVALAVWVICIVGVYDRFARYTFEGSPVLAPMAWPSAAAQLGPFQDRARTLLFFAHPRCSCTPASAEQLRRVLSRVSERPEILVLVYANAPLRPEATAAWKAALPDHLRAVPADRIIADPRGRWASLFGARTSGDIRVYDRQRELLFSGGITASRGHHGDSLGADALRDILNGAQEPVRFPVFGCGLSDSVEGAS